MKIRGFRFTSPANLAQAQAFNVVADNYNWANPMERGELVVVLSKNTADSYLAMIGVATGKQNEVEAEKVWPEWEQTKATVQGVKWTGKIVQVPTEIARKRGNRMSAEHAEEVFTYVMDN